MVSVNPQGVNTSAVNLGHVLNNGLHDYCAQVFHVGEQPYRFAKGLMEKILKQNRHSNVGFIDRDGLTDIVHNSLRQGVAQGFPEIAAEILESFVNQSNYLAPQTGLNANPLYPTPQPNIVQDRRAA